jgi:hypothetical protein
LWISLVFSLFKNVKLFVVKFITNIVGISCYCCVRNIGLQRMFHIWCVGKSTIFLRTKCHSPNYSGLLVIAMKPKIEEKFCMAAQLLFYGPQESCQKVASFHVSFLETISIVTKVVPTIEARMSVILYYVFILLLQILGCEEVLHWSGIVWPNVRTEYCEIRSDD